jgi:hypothetical protein
MELVTEMRGKTTDQLTYAKLGIDGGRGSIKIVISLLYEDDEVFDPNPSPRKRTKYSDGIQVNSMISWTMLKNNITN